MKTPGKLVLHYMGKKGKGPQCGSGGEPAARRAGAPPEGVLAHAPKKVSRGGSRRGVCVRKIVRAFLIEEQKIVKKVLKARSRRPRSEPGEGRA